MEVHHHPHVEKKNFKEYFLEFLMLFLAVTLGFFAENIREYFGEKKQEREYIQSMVNDLKTDTADIAAYIKINNESVLAYCDSLIEQLDKEKWNDTTIAAIYIYTEFQGRVSTYFFSEQTLTQLKSAGGAKLIKNRAALDSIMNYDAFISLAENQAKAYEDLTMKLIDTHGKIFYAKKINNVPKRDSATSNERIEWLVKNGKAKDLLIDNDQKDINGYIYTAKAREKVIQSYVTILGFVNEQAVHLINFLKKEYHLENE